MFEKHYPYIYFRLHVFIIIGYKVSCFTSLLNDPL